MRPGRRIRVLVAEDDYLVGEEISRSLRAIGYERIGVVSNGEAAVEQTAALRPDVVLMDIQMPEMDGLEAARRIQTLCPTPVVVVTAYESQDLVEKASAMGVSAYLTKPPSGSEIERAVTLAMARHDDLMLLRRLNRELERRKEELETALAEIKALRGLIPICANCKKIRNDGGYWEQVDVYLRKHSDARFSHGLCPDCRDDLVAGIEE